MKTMKTVMILFCMTFVAACQPTNTTTQTDPKEAVEVTVNLLVQGVPVENSEKVVKVAPGETVMTVMQTNYAVVEDKGLITTIDGMEADKGEYAGKYWKLLINGKMSEVGAGEAKVNAQDSITFDLTSDWSY